MIDNLLNTDFTLLKHSTVPDGFGGLTDSYVDDVPFKGDLQQKTGAQVLNSDAQKADNVFTLYCLPIALKIGDRFKDADGLIYKVNSVLKVRGHHLECEAELCV